MKKILLLLSLFLAGCAGMKTQPQESLTITKVIYVDSAGKEQIFKNAHKWVVTYWHLTSANPDSGIIMGTGEVGYPSAPVDRVEYTYVFQMRHEIQDNKDMFRLSRKWTFKPFDLVKYAVHYSGSNRKLLP